MKKLTIFILVIIVSLTDLYAQNKRLDQLIYTKQFTQADSLLQVTKLLPAEKLLYQAFLMNAFYQPARSNKLIKNVLSGRLTKNKRDLQYHLHKTRYDNYVQLNNYRKAYQTSLSLLTKYGNDIDPTDREGLLEETKIYHALKTIARQSVIKTQRSVIPITHDLAGLINIPVQTGGSSSLFVFDTGANISTITDSYANKLKLNILPYAPVNVAGSFNGISTLARLGIARKLKIGNVTVRNAVFLIFPDSALIFAGGAYKINGIIGFPVIKALEEIIITENTLTIPVDPEKVQCRPNLATDALTPIIYLNYSGQHLPFTFDSGAQSSILTNNFYDLFKDKINRDTKPDSLRLGGAGGNKDIKTLRTGNICLDWSGSIVCLTSAQISVNKTTGNDKFYYGNIGLDLIKQFREVTFNFHRATVTVKK